MRVVVQRVTEAKVTVNQETVGQIQEGLLLLVGIKQDDTLDDIKYVADKIAGLRIFEDQDERMNHSVMDIKGSILSVSQFTLYGDTRKGRRPNFMEAAKPNVAEPLYDAFNDYLRGKKIPVETGIFGAMMDVSFTNSGPITLIVESKEKVVK
ncbi:D-aminoacyl-tRNA deacylase [Terrilactibacillus laevilacticus]|uniref:D-aminoacyl-tRNA deacylase n=1 Tax=Terrilactibacillus laevilacticus TaxID=1380157 RepID=A0ABW5PTG0_9BACI|nr:D-aminoacyl-tRNA deacylase [Terrilactibacillus laevilacticus]